MLKSQILWKFRKTISPTNSAEASRMKTVLNWLNEWRQLLFFHSKIIQKWLLSENCIKQKKFDKIKVNHFAMYLSVRTKNIQMQ